MVNYNIIYGSLLGDSYIPKLNVNGKNYHLRCTHSLKQKEYALYKAITIGLPFNYKERNRYDKRTGKIYNCIEIRHNTNSLFNDIYSEFYRDNIKYINQNILSKLTPEAIAIWYCDDGNFYSNKKNYINHLSLATHCFSNNELLLLKDYFNTKWGIDFSITTQKQLRIAKISEIQKFTDIFSKYIPSCMEYKIADIYYI